MTIETSSPPAQRTAIPSVLVVALVGTLCMIYVVSQFLRNSIGVLAPELSREIGLEPEHVGLLSGVFFLSFALAQLPLGILIDRYGPRLAMLGSLVLALAGTAVFSAAEGLAGLVTGRVLMGLGCSSFLMAPLAVYARWFPADRFSTLAGIQLGFGTLGALIATAPLAYAAAALGWRTSFLLVVAFGVVAGILVIAFVRDQPAAMPPKDPADESLSKSLTGVVAAMRTPDVAPLFAMHLATTAVLSTILGVWGGPYLADVHGASLERRGEILLLMAAASVTGALLWGPADRWTGSRKRPVILGASTTIGILLILALTEPSGIYLPILFVMFGLAVAYAPVQIAHGRALFPDPLIGRGMTLLNSATMGGTFLLQSLTGFVVGGFTADTAGRLPTIAYQAAFGTAAAWLALALLIYLRAEDRPPR